MDEKKFKQMQNSLSKSMKSFPNCRIANCKCNSRNGEWKKGCNCMCHFFKMNELYGKENWRLKEFDKESKKGYGE